MHVYKLMIIFSKRAFDLLSNGTECFRMAIICKRFKLKKKKWASVTIIRYQVFASIQLG